MTRLGVIVARAANGAIGLGGKLPWHLPEDLAHLKRTTMGTPVIMGRKTWDSLPERVRPLPGRQNIVVTRNPAFAAPGGDVVTSLDEAVARCGDAPVAWIIGGAELCNLGLGRAQIAVVTEIDRAFDGDTFMPPFTDPWIEIARERHVSADGLAFSFVTYRNRKNENNEED